MRKIMLAGVAGLALAGLVGIGHNMPPVPISEGPTDARAVLPRRIADENRRNQKLRQKLRRAKRRQYFQAHSRARRKAIKFGPGYRPGKLFKGHRI